MSKFKNNFFRSTLMDSKGSNGNVYEEETQKGGNTSPLAHFNLALFQ